MRYRKRATGGGKWIGLILWLVLPGCFGPFFQARAHAYVMPAEQIVQFMTANFSKFQTLVIHQSTEYSEGQVARVFEEIGTMKFPNLFHWKMKDSTERRTGLRDHSYRQFFLANSGPGLMDFLSERGVELQKVAYTRVDGTIAFRIGGSEADSPRVLIEKARFLPLLFFYRSSREGDLIKVKFQDYRKVEQGWYPFQILFSQGEKINEKHTIRSIKVNVPVSLSLFDSPQ